MSYLGSKGQAGVWQRIIGQMPPHSFYIEPFFGSGQIFLRKRPASRNVIIDAGAGVIAKFNAAIVNDDIDRGNVEVIHGDAILHLTALKPTMTDATVIYCDPPYVHSTRTGLRWHRYKHEMEDEQHESLLAMLQALPAKILISGYPSKIYAEKLKKWRCIRYQVQTRGGPRTECLWCNFAKPDELHDWRFIGDGFRDRLNLKRFAARFLARLDAMPPLKRNFVMSLVDARVVKDGEAHNGSMRPTIKTEQP